MLDWIKDSPLAQLLVAAAGGALLKFMLSFKKRGWRKNMREGAIDTLASTGIGFACAKIALGLGYGQDMAIGIAVLSGHFGARIVGMAVSKYLDK